MAHRRAPDVAAGQWRIWRTRDGLDVEYTDQDGTGYLVEISLTQRPHWSVQAITFKPGPSGDPVTSGGIREFKFGAVVQAAIGMFFDYTDPEDWDDHGRSLLPTGRDLQKLETRSTMLQAVDLYRQALAKGSRTPTKDAALALNRSPSYIAKLLSHARDQQLLGPAPSGKAGER